MNEHSRQVAPAPAPGATPGAPDPAADSLDARIGRILADQGPAASGVLASALGAPVRTVQRRLGRLALQGDVTQPKRGVWQLTAVGRRAAIAAAVPALAPLDVSAVLAKLPPWHAAMVRLGVGAAITRRALAAEYPGNWPTLIALGRTKTGKTLIGYVICRILGLDPTAQIRMLSFETAGSVGIRRTQRAGGDFDAKLAALLRAPFVVFDELDKAPAEVRRAVGAVLLGQSVVAVEGARLEVRATPMVTLNDDRERAQLLSEAHLRRAVVLNTRAPALREAIRDLDQAAHELERSAIQALPADLAPPAAQLPAPARDLLRAVLIASLSELGWERADVEPLARIALGYWALDPQGGPELAAARVALDYLLCTATCEGELREDWDARFAAAAASARLGDGQLRAALAAAATRQDVARAARGAALEGSRQAELALTVRRAELRAAIDGAIRGAPRRVTDDERTVRAAAIAKGRVFREWVGAAASLEELLPIARQIEADVAAPLRELVAARKRATADARREREAEAQRRRWQREESRRIDRYVGQLRRLYQRRRTRPGEDVLGQLLDLGCVVERSEHYVVEIEPSVLERAVVAVGAAARAIWHGSDTPQHAPEPFSDPYGLGLRVFLDNPPAAAALRPADTRLPRTERRVRTWYEDRAERTSVAAELRAWAAPAVRRALEAAAAVYRRGL